jgi:hypothetical protein
MEFKDNFSEILLIAEAPVIFYADDPYLIKTIDLIMTLPNLRQTLTNPHIQLALAIFQMRLTDLQRAIPSVQFNSLWELIVKLYASQPGNQFCRTIEYYLCSVFGEQIVINNFPWRINEIEVDEKLFMRIAEISLISAGLKDFKDQAQFQADKPQWLIEKENEIKRIKSQSQTKTGEYNNFQELAKILMPLNYELGYSFEELFAMNYFHIKFLGGYIPKMIGYDISKRQIMSKKKIKYITDK